MPEIPAELLALIANADPTTVPPPVETTGPDDETPADQEPGFEEADVADSDADAALADPAVQED
jgi:hypothetical protein